LEIGEKMPCVWVEKVRRKNGGKKLAVVDVWVSERENEEGWEDEY
jgi:hypothetical protein